MINRLVSGGWLFVNWKLEISDIMTTKLTKSKDRGLDPVDRRKLEIWSEKRISIHHLDRPLEELEAIEPGDDIYGTRE